MNTLFPVEKGNISQYYDGGKDFYPTNFGTSSHGAWDIVSFHGDKLRACKDGTVFKVYDLSDQSLATGLSKGFGVHMISTPDANGLCEEWIYWHMMSNLAVKPEQPVKQGDILGYEGDSGQVFQLTNGVFAAVPDSQKGVAPYPGTHVHWGYRQLQQTKIADGKRLVTQFDGVTPYQDKDGNYYEILNFNNCPATITINRRTITVNNRGLLDIGLRTDVIQYDQWLLQQASETANLAQALAPQLNSQQQNVLWTGIKNLFTAIINFFKGR